ncbi:MAG: NnrU family protein [Ancalomicrobiaceae bacterium]|nr:NnrU family protein [Ancalomicrobiaceae bacterium]
MGLAAMVAVAGITFTVLHIASSNLARPRIVARWGEQAFLGIHSLLSASLLTWLGIAYYLADPGEPLWDVGDGLWIAASVLTAFASVLLIGSLVKNPAAIPPAELPDQPPPALGVYCVTRHPMMWGIALWAISHILTYPFWPQVFLSASIGTLALAGSAFQDVKKRRALPVFWPVWQARTSFWPCWALLTGRARWGGWRPLPLLIAAVFWLAVTWVHIPLGNWPAGIWRWL